MRSGLIIQAGLALGIATGCSPSRMAMRQAIDMSIRALPVYDRETDVEFGGQAVAGQIKLLEGLLESAPNDPKLLLALTRSYSRYAFGYVQLKIDCADHLNSRGAQERWIHQALNFYERARAYGMRLLKLTHPGITTVLAADSGALASALEGFGVEEAPALFWMAFAWGNELSHQAITPQTLAALRKAAQMVQRVVELDERILCGSAHLYLGSYYSQLPAFLGGDVVRADEHFRRARQIDSGAYLPARLLQVEYAWRSTGDTCSYLVALHGIVEAETISLPEFNLDNAVARRKASIRLANVDSSFVCECAGAEMGFWLPQPHTR